MSTTAGPERRRPRRPEPRGTGGPALVALTLLATVLSGGLVAQMVGVSAEPAADVVGLAAVERPLAAAGHQMGLRVRVSTTGSVTRLTFPKHDAAVSRVVTVWGPDGAVLARSRTVGESAGGLQVVRLARAVTLRPGIVYVIGYWSPAARPASAASRSASRSVSTSWPPVAAQVRAAGFVTGPGHRRPDGAVAVDPGLRVHFTPSPDVAASQEGTSSRDVAASPR